MNTKQVKIIDFDHEETGPKRKECHFSEPERKEGYCPTCKSTLCPEQPGINEGKAKESLEQGCKLNEANSGQEKVERVSGVVSTESQVECTVVKESS